MNDLFNALVKESGLSPIFARTVVDRALRRAGVEPDSLQRSDVERVLPELERALTVYLGDKDASARTAALRRAFGR